MNKFNKKRVAYFGDVDASTKVNLEFLKAVPFMNLSNVSGSTELMDDTIQYPQCIKEINVDAKPETPTTSLYFKDNDGNVVNDRYTYVATIPSELTHSVGYLYHDAIEKDLFLIPDLDLFTGDTGSDSYLDNNEITIVATLIGSYDNRIGEMTNLLSTTVPNLKGMNKNIDSVEDISEIKIQLMVLPGLDGNGHFNNAGYMATDVLYYESKQHTIVQMVSLGSSTTLLGADKKVNLHKIVTPDFNTHRLLYVGEQTSVDLLIPINY